MDTVAADANDFPNLDHIKVGADVNVADVNVADVIVADTIVGDVIVADTIVGNVFVADQLSPQAREYFFVGNWIEKYSSRFSLADKLDNMIEEMEREAILAQAQAAAAQAQAAPGAPAPINFWTAPLRFKKEKTAPAVLNFQPGATTVPGCICDVCTGEVDCVTAGSDSRPRASVISIVAPLGWCALFIVCSISIITQLISLSNSNTAATKRLCDSGKYQEALRASNLALRCNPFSATTYFERARVLTHMIRYREAADCLDRSLSINPSNRSALDARAALSLKLGRPEQTIKDTYKLIALNGGRLNAMQCGNMAIAFYKIGRFDQAIDYYNKALAYDKHNLTMDLGKAYCLSGKQQHRAALASCNQLLKAYGSEAQVLALKGYCLQRLHDLAAAERAFDQALARAPQNASFYSYRAALMTELKKPEAALKDYTRAADLDRDSAQTQYVVAKMLKDLGRNKEALAYYDRLERFPSFVYSYDQHDERAALNYSAGRYQACLSDLNRAIELKPECRLYARKALCLAHLGNLDEARAAIAHANSQDPDSRSLLLAEAQVDAILGQNLSAMDKFSRLLRSESDNKDALYGRGQIYYGRGQWASAAQDLKKVVAMGGEDAGIRGQLAHCQQVLASGAKISLDLPKQKLVDLGKYNASALAESGRKAFQDGDMQLATIYFTELVRRQPSNLDARKCLAHSLEGAGNHQEAVAVFEPLSQRQELALNDQFCYAHALAAAGLYDRSIAIMERLSNWEPSNLNYRLELTKMFSAAGQIDKAIGMCRQALAMGGSSEERRSLNNVYESLLTEKLRGKKGIEGGADAAAASSVETQG